MAITDLSNEELVDMFAAAFMMESYSDSKLARAELLRRLSAGNPQAERAADTQATGIIRAIVYAGDGCRGHRDCRHSMRPWEAARQYLADVDGEPLAEPERSDGRIQAGDPAFTKETYSHGRSGEQRETRIQGGEWKPSVAGPTPMDYANAEAQRSAGRIEAGSEQGSESAAEDPRDYDVDRLPRGV